MKRIVVCVFFLGALSAAELGQCQALSKSANSAVPSKIDSKRLPNPIQLHEKVISGGLPEGDEAFKELADRGIKTIISVDGMKPDVEMACMYGLRYIHLPHGYDGIPPNRVEELAKAVRDLEGPIYIHCHHGKHRSPAAACVACVSAGLIAPQEAVPILQLAGTNPSYRGLFKAVENARLISAHKLDAMTADFKEVQTTPAMVEAMVEIGHVHEHVGLIAKAQWQSPGDHPDLDPAHEALLLRELFAELLRAEDSLQQPADFMKMLRDSEIAALELHEQLSKLKGLSATEIDHSKLNNLSKTIADNCKSCHVQYRDVPLDEKR